MNQSSEQQKEWQQYYPTYDFGDRDIVLKEYENASNNVLSQERVFTNAANLLLIISTLVGSAFVAYVQNQANLLLVLTLKPLLIFTLLLSTFSWLTVRYFADRQKSIIFDSRKIVVLRKMLGLDYGSFQLVLPNWRIEGASNPFAIRLFPGWFTSTAYPLWIITLSSASGLLYFLPTLIPQCNEYLLKDLGLHLFYIDLNPNLASTVVSIIWALFLAFSFRRSLYDSNENLLLLLSLFLGRILRVRLVDSIEYTVYRARLGYHDLERLRAGTNLLKPFLVHFEDRSFYENWGVSIRGMFRAIRDYIIRRKVSGGSTLTQQLVRSLFIVDYHKTLRRKLIEVPLALWATSKFSKNEILELYIASVKYEKGVFGLAAAMHFFFPGGSLRNISKAMAFFLVERVSNTKSKILADRLRILASVAGSENLLAAKDLKELREIYESQVSQHRLEPSDDSVFHDWLSNFN